MNITPLKTLLTLPSIYMFSLNVASTASGFGREAHHLCDYPPLLEHSELRSCTTDAFKYTVFLIS